MDLKLNDKVAWVTGSSKGIGRECARRLAQEGCRVLLNGRDAASLEAARKDFAKEFGEDRVAAGAGDVWLEPAAQAAADICRQKWGRLDILVANAGTGRIAGGYDPSQKDWEEALGANLGTATQALRVARRLLEASGMGAVVVIGSIAGIEDLGAPAAYAAAKAALHAWAKTQARSLAPKKIRVNTVILGNILFPGGTWDVRLKKDRKKIEAYIKEEVPMGRFGEAGEIADAVVFLASERASFITGAALVADGGQTREF